jgi:hypothetical protein
MQTEMAELSEPFHDQRQTCMKHRCSSCCGLRSVRRDRGRLNGEISKLTCATLKHTDLVAGLEVHSGVMEILSVTKGEIVSEAVMMALADKMGPQVAHDRVYYLCRRSAEEDVAVYTRQGGLRRVGKGRTTLLPTIWRCSLMVERVVIGTRNG